MKRFKAWRYKCDFCGKNGYSAGHMRHHELHCTMNPERICRVHKFVTGNDDDATIQPVVSLIAALREHWNDEDHGVKHLRDITDGCPCCILAVIRQSGASKGYTDEDGYSPPHIGQEQFDFKKEMASLWADVNDTAREGSCY